MQRYAIAAMLLMGSVLAGPMHGLEVTAQNHSNWVLAHVYVSIPDRNQWGNDALDGTLIGTGDSFAIVLTSCAAYDVKLVNDREQQCVLPSVDLCGSEHVWVLTNDYLLLCKAPG